MGNSSTKSSASGGGAAQQQEQQQAGGYQHQASSAYQHQGTYNPQASFQPLGSFQQQQSHVPSGYPPIHQQPQQQPQQQQQWSQWHQPYGASPSQVGTTPGAHLPSSRTLRFRAIADKYSTVEEVQDELRLQGLESSNLIVAVDFTKSNEWTGKHSFGGQSLHKIASVPNLYEQAISIIGRTLESFDEDNLIPCYGFGDASTKDRSVFSFNANDEPSHGLEAVLHRYRELVPHVRLAGPTSFAPAIYQAMKLVAASEGQYHILVLIADGQVTRSADTLDGQWSPQEEATVQAIVAASQFPLSIIMIGVGDGPWEIMKEFDDRLPERRFDNFQFVNFTEIIAMHRHEVRRSEAMFALKALMEVPDQYKLMSQLGLLSRPSPFHPQSSCINPPGPTAPAPPAGGQYASTRQGVSSSSPPSYSFNNAVAQNGPVEDNKMFLCPITQDVMTEPVIAADGHTYERSAIQAWFQSHDSSPMSGQAMTSRDLIPNYNLRSAIQEALAQRH